MEAEVKEGLVQFLVSSLVKRVGGGTRHPREEMLGKE